MAASVQDAILLFGDSLTQGSFEPGGLGQRLAHVYARKLDIINRGLSGYNTTWAFPVLEKAFAKREEYPHVQRVRLLVIWFGANDACLEPSPQHVPLPRFRSNLENMINLVTSPESSHYSPSTAIILITPPPVNVNQRQADLASRNPPLPVDRNFDVTKSYADAVKSFSAANSVGVTDIWTPIWRAAEEEESKLSRFLSDGLHLNAEGYEIVYDALLKTIVSKFPELQHEGLEYVFAPWKELDWSKFA